MRLSVQTMLVLAPLTFGIGLLGGAALADAPVAPGSEAPEKGPEVAPEPHGLYRFVAEALTDVDLKPEQKDQIAQIGEQLQPIQAKVTAARTALLLALADNLEAGRVDRTNLKDEVDALVAARAGASPAMRQAFVRLHGILDPKQRTAFVDALVKRMTSADKKEAARAMVEQWAKDLDLKDEQKEALRGVLEKHAAGFASERANVQRALASFRGDTFDPEEIAPASEVPANVRKRTEGMLDVTESIARVLTPEQRKMAAAKIRETVGEPKGEKPEQESPKVPRPDAAPEGELGEATDAFVAARRTTVARGWGGGFGRSTVVRRGGMAYGGVYRGGGMIY